MPALSIERPANAATPFTAATDFVPERVPLPGFVPSATATVALEEVTTFP